MFYGLLFKNEQINGAIFSKLYLDKNLNYLYSDMYYKLLNSSLSGSYDFNLQHLNQLNYILTLLNSYFKHSALNHSEFASRIINDTGKCIHLLSKNDWFYFLNSLLIIDLYGERSLSLNVSAVKNYEEVKNLLRDMISQFDKLVFENDFMRHLLDILNAENNNQNFLDLVLSGSRIELNNVSLFLHGFVNKMMSSNLEKNRKIVDSLSRFATNLFKSSNGEILILFLYEIPFARYSILQSLDKVKENVEHYYNVFANLIENIINTKLTVVIEQLKELTIQESQSSLLSAFNSTLNVLTKYVSLYFKLVAESAEPDSKFYTIFNMSVKTNDFLQNVLSRLLMRILDLFCDLKASLKSPNGYFYFFNFEKDPLGSDLELRWNQISFLDKLSVFMGLFFTQLNKNHKEMSIYLNEKHWDFILCYASSIVQGLNRTLAKHETETYLQLFAINFFGFLKSVIKTIKYRVSVDSDDFYPKNIHSDWCGFFSKEVFDPLLQTYVRLAISNESSSQLKPYLSNQSLKYETYLVLNQISVLISEITFDRLLLNQLEPKFNVLDMNLSVALGQKTVAQAAVKLPDSLKTLLNYLIPNLKHQDMSVQLSSYAILRTIMKEVNKYYEQASSKSDSG
jgi:hypothetical protein